MRSVSIFPRAGIDWAKQRLQSIAREERDGEWFIDAANEPDLTAIYVRIESTSADRGALYCDWEPSAMEGLKAALGQLPDWSVVGDVSGRIPGEDEVRGFVLDLLVEGGVALDDYSDHCWTSGEIAENRVVDGLTFFDYRTSFQRDAGV